MDCGHVARIDLLSPRCRYLPLRLFLGFDEAFDEQALHEDDDEDGGSMASITAVMTPLRLHGSRRQPFDPHDDGVVAAVGSHQQRPEILHPAIG